MSTTPMVFAFPVPKATVWRND